MRPPGVTRPPVCGLPILLALPLAALFAAASGCVSLHRTPEARFFVLRALSEPAGGSAAPATGAAPAEHVGVSAAASVSADTPRPAGDGLVGLLPVRIPEHLNRPQLVRWSGPNELRIDEFLRWSEPLDVGVTRTLAEDLGILLPQARVLRAPWRASVPVRCRVATEVRLFGPQADGTVRLEGRFVLLASEGERPLARRVFAFRREAPPEPLRGDPGASVERMSDLLSDLAREIAAAYAELPGQPAQAREGAERP